MPLPPSLLPSKTFKLFSSAPSSFNRVSLPSRAPSSALGIASFSDLTSSLIRRVSSSRRREAFFMSETRFSTSLRAPSSRSVRASSADFKVAVSVESCSIRANARLNCSSMCSLSCSNWGGVGGAIKGEMYRLMMSQYSDQGTNRDTDLCDSVKSVSYSPHYRGHDKPITPVPFGGPVRRKISPLSYGWARMETHSGGGCH